MFFPFFESYDEEDDALQTSMITGIVEMLQSFEKHTCDSLKSVENLLQQMGFPTNFYDGNTELMNYFTKEALIVVESVAKEHNSIST